MGIVCESSNIDALEIVYFSSSTTSPCLTHDVVILLHWPEVFGELQEKRQW